MIATFGSIGFVLSRRMEKMGNGAGERTADERPSYPSPYPLCTPHAENFGILAGDLVNRRAWHTLEDFRAVFSASGANRDGRRAFEKFSRFFPS